MAMAAVGAAPAEAAHRSLESFADNPTSPLGCRWSRELPLPTPFFPFGDGFTPPPTPSPGPGRGGSRVVGMSKMAQDGSKRASESPRWPPRWLKIAQARSRWLPRCSKRPQDRPKTAPSGQKAPQGAPQEANILPKPRESQCLLLSRPFALGAVLGHLGRPNASRPAPSRSVGRGKPLPEGEEGGWKRKLPRPPTPRGLVGLISRSVVASMVV